VTGESTLVVKKGGASAAETYSSLGLQLGANARVLARGQTATMTILVSGLQSLKEPAWVVISNHAPHVIDVAGGVVQQIAIQPANVRSDGRSKWNEHSQE
jgi:hypothetical protein